MWSNFDRIENAIFIHKFQTGKNDCGQNGTSNKKVDKTGSHKIFELPSFAAEEAAKSKIKKKKSLINFYFFCQKY